VEQNSEKVHREYSEKVHRGDRAKWRTQVGRAQHC
jgi:hypothetical protein